jgi:hypothetical protein
MNAPLRLEDLQAAVPRRQLYVPVRAKFAIALAVALAWTGFSVYLARYWMRDLARVTDPLFAPVDKVTMLLGQRMLTASEWARIRNSPEVDAFVLAWIASHVPGPRRARRTFM